MKKIIAIFITLCALVLLFSGCWQIRNITDPIPDEYTKGIKIPKDYPDDLEIYNGVVFESSNKQGMVTIKYGVNSTLDSIVEFYEKLFDDKGFVIEKSNKNSDGYTADGAMDGYTFDIEVMRPSGSYEIRSYVWVVEISVSPSDIVISEQTNEPGDNPTEATPEPVIIYPDSLSMITGFWQFCGGMESTDIYYKSHGVAVEIKENMTITGYDNFEVLFENVPFSFASEDVITFKFKGEVQRVKFYFINIYGDYEYLTMHGENYTDGETVFSGRAEIHLEKTSYDDMLKHKGLKEEYEKEITLDEPITDKEMEFLIMETDWIASYYYYPDGSTDRAGKYEMYRFNTGHVGMYADENGNVSRFSWALVDNHIYLYYHNGTEEAFLLDYSNDGSFNTNLYFFDIEDGRLTRALVFIRFAC